MPGVLFGILWNRADDGNNNHYISEGHAAGYGIGDKKLRVIIESQEFR